MTGSAVPSVALPAVAVLTAASALLWLCPFTKVEESFNLQAAHDLLELGPLDVSAYDHLQFPGVVPRTFLGPMAVSAAAWGPDRMLRTAGYSKMATQVLVRFVLGLFVMSGLVHLWSSLRATLGSSVAVWHGLIIASQFHLCFYMTRPLPNVFALVPALHALALWLRGGGNGGGRAAAGPRFAFVLAAAAAVVIFRGELAMLFAPIVLVELLLGRISFFQTLAYGLASVALVLPLTVAVDSYFWRSEGYLWPEGQVLYYNVVLNKSSAWGTQPWPWYFYNCLPRVLAASLPLAALGIYLDRRTLRVAFPALVFVFLFSFLPHKETRFILYAFPLLDVPAAAACDRLWRNASKPGLARKAAAALAAGHLAANLAWTVAAAAASAANYPGGQALAALHHHLGQSSHIQPVQVHLDNLACQTGASRFGQLRPDWGYDKTESLSLRDKLTKGYSHLVLEIPAAASEREEVLASFELLEVVEQSAGAGVDWRRAKEFMLPVFFKRQPVLWVLERKDWKGRTNRN